MGSGNINIPVAGDTIRSTLYNELINALKGNLVPRNSLGVAQNLAGKLGDSDLYWDKLFTNEIRINNYRIFINSDNNLVFSSGTGESFVISSTPFNQRNLYLGAKNIVYHNNNITQEVVNRIIQFDLPAGLNLRYFFIYISNSIRNFSSSFIINHIPYNLGARELFFTPEFEIQSSDFSTSDRDNLIIEKSAVDEEEWSIRSARSSENLINYRINVIVGYR